MKRFKYNDKPGSVRGAIPELDLCQCGINEFGTLEETFYTQALRRYNGVVIALPIEVYFDYDGGEIGVSEVARISQTTDIAEFLLLKEDFALGLTDDEIDQIRNCTEVSDHVKDCQDADYDHRTNQAEAEREFIGDAKRRGWAK